MTKTRKRTAKKLVLPMLAIAMMSLMMYLDASNRQQPAPSRSHAAARMAPDLHQR